MSKSLLNTLYQWSKILTRPRQLPNLDDEAAQLETTRAQAVVFFQEEVANQYGASVTVLQGLSEDL